MQNVPLFPLNTVLFPNAPLSLHIFEERYRLMIGRCLEQATSFGVVLLREGTEVAEEQSLNQPPIPFAVGTIAQINEHVRLADGRYLLAAVGAQRFRIHYLLQNLPYMIASVAFLPEEPNAPLESLTHEVQTLYARYWQAVADATGFQAEPETLPAEPLALSYQLADRLQVSNQRKQHWLEADTVARLRDILTVLHTEIDLFPTSRRSHYHSGPYGAISLN